LNLTHKITKKNISEPKIPQQLLNKSLADSQKNTTFVGMSGIDLDVDLEIDGLRHPERYPLVIKRNALDVVGV